MSKAFPYFRSSIKRKISSMMAISLLLILAGASFVSWGSFKSVREYSVSTERLIHRQELITEIANLTNDIILQVRGYYIYLNDSDYEQIFKSREALDKAIASLKQSSLTDEEQQFVQRAEQFFDQYLNRLLPAGAEFARKGDYESLRILARPGVDNPVDEIVAYAHEFEIEIQMQLKDEWNEIIRVLAFQGIYFILYVLLILIISLLITRALAKDIGDPIRRLSQYALNHDKGDSIQADLTDRQDEIGLLSRSLDRMTYEIQEKGEELLAQNEELQAQQDELQAQQEELQRALGIMGDNEAFLNKRHRLSQLLATETDRRALLDSIVRNVAEITRSDKGILVLMNEARDYAACGISQEEAAQFLDGLGRSAFVRSVQNKQQYVRERDATAEEKGYLSGAVSACDIFIPLYKGNGELAAGMAFTRIGKAIDNRDEMEFMGLAGQISLSLEKLEMFEITEGQWQMTRDMLDTIQEGVQFLDLAGRSLHVNSKLCELLGLPGDSAASGRISLEALKARLAVIVAEPKPLFKFIDRALSGDASLARSMTYVLGGPEPRYIQMYWEPINRNKAEVGILLVHRDITREHEVDRMKSEFVSTVSHELRTPLSSILGFSELMLNREMKPERQHKYLTTIHQEAVRLTQLINDFLDLQRMENGAQQYHMDEIDIIELIEQVKELQQAATSRHRIISSHSCGKAVVLGDRDKLYQALVNLVSNAIKYSPAGGDVTIATRLEDGTIRIDVADEGLGIPEQAIPNLFSKFYRVDNTDRREIGGTGLGLAIVKEIMTRHRGDVGVNSRLGAGSTFRMALPLLSATIEEVEHEGATDNDNGENAM